MPWLNSQVTYCSNVHPYETIDGLKMLLQHHIIPIKYQRNLDCMSLGLWLNESLIAEMLASEDAMKEVVELFLTHQLTICTLNAFPQHSFHAKRVKENVYLPDWSEKERQHYTLKILGVIERYPMLFENSLSISTVPLGYKAAWNKEKHMEAITHLQHVATQFQRFFQATGTQIRLCLEMEPDCVLESTKQMVDFFQQDLNIANQKTIQQHLGVCFDICHQAVMHEDIHESLETFKRAEIVIGKIQISNAIEFENDQLEHVSKELEAFFKSPFLHQIKTLQSGDLLRFSDLNSESLEKLPKAGTSRMHLHVPINNSRFTSHLKTTQNAILEVFDWLSNEELQPHLEIETYTWSILKTSMEATELNENIIKECKWLTQVLGQRNLIVECQ